jgi:hypothetical protein
VGAATGLVATETGAVAVAGVDPGAGVVWAKKGQMENRRNTRTSAETREVFMNRFFECGNERSSLEKK